MTAIVVDTNVLISAAIKRDGLEARVIALCAEGALVPWISDALEAEYRAVAARKKFAKQARTLAELTEALVGAARRVAVNDATRRCSDPDDDMVLACALAGGARFLITGNTSDFPAEVDHVRVLNARQALEALALLPPSLDERRAAHEAFVSPMSLYEQTVPQFIKLLTNLEGWLDVAVEHAKSKNYDPNVLLQSRLAPDQFNLLKQLQSVCDQTKFVAARTANKEPPKHPDTESNLDEIRARISSVKSFLATLTPADFEGADKRIVPLPFMPGKGVEGAHYVNQMGLPNVYFHLCMSYAILRHNGVDLGKRNYIGAVPLLDL